MTSLCTSISNVRWRFLSKSHDFCTIFAVVVDVSQGRSVTRTLSSLWASASTTQACLLLPSLPQEETFVICWRRSRLLCHGSSAWSLLSTRPRRLHICIQRIWFIGRDKILELFFFALIFFRKVIWRAIIFSSMSTTKSNCATLVSLAKWMVVTNRWLCAAQMSGWYVSVFLICRSSRQST